MTKHNKAHILYLTRWYPTAADPMLGLFVKKHALAATAAGYRVTVVYVTYLPHPEGKRQEIHTEGLLTEYIYHLTKPAAGTGIVQQLLTWEKAMRTVAHRQGKPELIHAHVLTRHGFLAWWLGAGWHIPFLVTEHWSRYYPENFQFNGAIRTQLTRYVLKKAAAVTVVSHRLADAMRTLNLKFNPKILPNVVDTSIFKPLAGKQQSKTIVSITCFDEKSKNLDLLLRVFKRLLQHFPDFKLQLIGDGVDLDWTRQRAEFLGLKDKVVFSGTLQGEELGRALAGAACLAVSSNYETFAIVAFEALSCGTPVVATNVADLASHIKPEWGAIVPPGDENAYLEELIRIIQKPQWPVDDMHKYVKTNFSEIAVSGILDDLYRNILKNKS
ncbi:D-inositol-3-phosphate glycosyltransferase [anaerobic digester metagenome]|nr:glycosyltransferase [Lentimicrobiaceae bacterium]